MTSLKASAIGLALSLLASSALAAEAAKCCCCKEAAEKMSCCDKKEGSKPAEKPAVPDQHQQHSH